MLEARDLVIRLGGRTVVDVPSLALAAGETVALIGPNGAGKSTLLLALALLPLPAVGQVRIGGELASSANELRLRRRLAVVFQEPLLLDTTVTANVGTGLALRGVARAEREALVTTWLARFGVGELASRSARQLSGGEAQRVSLARAFALQPEVLFLDEPFSALDAPTRAAIATDLATALRSTETTALLVTHDRDEALAFGDRVGVMIGGRLRQIGAPEEVFGSPVDAEVAEFVGVETIAPGIVVTQEDGLVRVLVGTVSVEVASKLSTGQKVSLCLRPEDVTLYPTAPGDRPAPGSARNQLPGRIVAISSWGGQARVRVDCGFPLIATITRRSASELGLVEGTPVRAAFKATSAHLIPRS